MVYDLFDRYPSQFTVVGAYESDYYKDATTRDKWNMVSLDGDNWGLMNFENGSLLVNYLYNIIYCDPIQQYAEVYVGSKIGILDLKTGNLTLYGHNDMLFGDNFGVIWYKKLGKYGVNHIDGSEILPAKYEDIIITPYGEYAVLKPGASKYEVIDEQGNTLFVFDDGIQPIFFLPSIDCWECYFQHRNEDEGIWYTDGFISRDGS